MFILILMRGSLSFASMFFIARICVVALALVTSTMGGGGYIPSPCYDVIDERLVFCCCLIKGFCSKCVITICKFYKLYGDYCCRGFWWGVVIWMSYDAQYVWFKLGIANGISREGSYLTSDER